MLLWLLLSATGVNGDAIGGWMTGLAAAAVVSALETAAVWVTAGRVRGTAAGASISVATLVAVLERPDAVVWVARFGSVATKSTLCVVEDGLWWVEVTGG